MTEGDQNLEKIKVDELRQERLLCINRLLEPYKLQINIEFVDIVLQYANFTIKEWQDIVDYVNDIDIEVEPKYKSVDDYIYVLSNRLADAITDHDLQEVEK